MANNILEKVNIEKVAKNIKKTASNLNKEAMKTSDNIVEGAIKTGNEWTKIFEKAAKNGTALFGKQQDIVLDALEGIKEQTFAGTKRFSKLINFPTISKRFTKVAQEATETVKEKVAETRKSIDGVWENAMDSEVVKKANEIINTSKTASKKVANEVTKKANEVVKTSKTASKKVAKKATTNVKVKNDNLKVIEGVGPKLAAILNDAGIKTYKHLADSKVSTLKAILAAAGPRYKMHDPTSWAKQAKFAAAGRMAELKKLQAELKGGKTAKK